MSTPLQNLSKPLQSAGTSYRPIFQNRTILCATTSPLGRPTPFSTSSSHQARRQKGRGERLDPRVRNIRYHLSHPLTPRPLRLSRLRALRHWTIHRAWQLFKGKQRQEQELTLERQYNSMRDACEALRLIGEDGLAVSGDTGNARTVRPPGARDPQAVSVVVGTRGTRLSKVVGPRWAIQGKQPMSEAAIGEETVELDLGSAAAMQRDVGRLYRIAMEKKGVFTGVPIEYSRLQTDTPSKAGWDHEWKRASLASINVK